MPLEQLLYTWASVQGGGHGGGWGVLDRSPGLPADAEERLLSRRTTSMRNFPPLPTYPATQDLQNRVRRMRVEADGDAWLINHVVDAGPAGRPDNVMNHLVRVPRAELPRPVEVWRSADWCLPYKQQEVVASRVPATLTAGPLTRHQVLDWCRSEEADEALPWLLDAVQAGWGAGRPVVLMTRDADEAAAWIAAITHLTGSGAADPVHWSTFEDAESLNWACSNGFHLIGVLREQLTVDEVRAVGALALDPWWEPEPSRTGWTLPDGTHVPYTAWPRSVLSLLAMPAAQADAVLRTGDLLAVGAGRDVALSWSLSLALCEREPMARLDEFETLLVDGAHLTGPEHDRLRALFAQGADPDRVATLQATLHQTRRDRQLAPIQEWLASDLPDLARAPQWSPTQAAELAPLLRPEVKRAVRRLREAATSGGARARQAAQVAECVRSLGLAPAPVEPGASSLLDSVVEALARGEQRDPDLLAGLELPSLTADLTAARGRIQREEERARRVAMTSPDDGIEGVGGFVPGPPQFPAPGPHLAAPAVTVTPQRPGAQPARPPSAGVTPAAPSFPGHPVPGQSFPGPSFPGPAFTGPASPDPAAPAPSFPASAPTATPVAAVPPVRPAAPPPGAHPAPSVVADLDRGRPEMDHINRAASELGSAAERRAYRAGMAEAFLTRDGYLDQGSVLVEDLPSPSYLLLVAAELVVGQLSAGVTTNWVAGVHLHHQLGGLIGGENTQAALAQVCLTAVGAGSVPRPLIAQYEDQCLQMLEEIRMNSSDIDLTNIWDVIITAKDRGN